MSLSRWRSAGRLSVIWVEALPTPSSTRSPPVAAAGTTSSGSASAASSAIPRRRMRRDSPCKKQFLLTADERQHLIAYASHRRLIRTFDVEPQQRLGVGRADVEPPAVRAAHRQPVELVLL